MMLAWGGRWYVGEGERRKTEKGAQGAAAVSITVQPRVWAPLSKPPPRPVASCPYFPFFSQTCTS